MGLFKSGSSSGGVQVVNAPPPPPDPAPTPPSFASANASSQAYGKRQKGGFASTILTSPELSLQPANTARKTLLGE